MRVISVDLLLQSMTCRVCEDVHDIPRKLTRDQHELLLMQDTVEFDHRECRENERDPRRPGCIVSSASAARVSKKKQQPSRFVSRPRCNGRVNA